MNLNILCCDPFREDGTAESWGVETNHPNIFLCGAGAIRGGGVSGQGCPTLVALTEHFEQELRAHSGEGHIAQLIDDQELDGVEMFLKSP